MRPHHKAGHMAAHDQIVKPPKSLATQAPSTHGLIGITPLHGVADTELPVRETSIIVVIEASL